MDLYRSQTEINEEDEKNLNYSTSGYFEESNNRTPEQKEEIDRILQLKSCENPYDYYKVLKLYTSTTDENFSPASVTLKSIRKSYLLLR
jgi:hypothetical protein